MALPFRGRWIGKADQRFFMVITYLAHRETPIQMGR